MRERIYTIVEKAKPNDKLSKFYDLFIMVVALISIIPLMFKEPVFSIGGMDFDVTKLFNSLDTITVYILFLDYILRWISFDYISKKPGPWAFIRYPVTPFALIDLISILPSLGLLGQGMRILRMLRIFKIFHYSKTFTYVTNVFNKEKKTLGSVLVIALAYIFVSALAMFSYEPDTFDNFFGALYWATTALTTVGYGDVYPLSDLGKLISMVSSLFGIAVIALPAGVVTAGFVEELNREKKEAERREETSDEE